MKRWISVVVVLAPLLSSCIPIGIRGSTVPYASLERPLERQHLVNGGSHTYGLDAAQPR